MKYSHTIIAATVLVLLLAGCGKDDPSVPALGPFASTLEGKALAKYEEMTPRQRHGVETLAEQLGPERTTEWLLASSEERLRSAFVADGVERITEEQKGVLMAVPAELPPIEDLVFPELVAEFEGLPPRLKEIFWSDVGTTLAHGMTVGGWGLPPLTDEEVRKMFSRRIEQYQRASPIYENRG